MYYSRERVVKQTSYARAFKTIQLNLGKFKTRFNAKAFKSATSCGRDPPMANLIFCSSSSVIFQPHHSQLSPVVIHHVTFSAKVVVLR